MIYLIDNYDSFTYNLYQLVGKQALQPITVIKNDQLTLQELIDKKPTGLIFSPGPGRPEDAGRMIEYLNYFQGKIPILGVCLGEQAIAEIYGGKVVHADHLMHGKASEMHLKRTSKFFPDCPNDFMAARYHSLIVDRNSLPKNLSVTAETNDGEIMALSDESQKVYGVQFHPESIMTDTQVGQQIVHNFLKMI